jgi:hypothetical protein
VVPVPIASLSFSAGNARGSPAPAGDPVTGTVTLDREAPINTVIYLSSNTPQSASVPPSVTVPQGQQRATFRILTSPNGGPSGSVFSAVIQASDPLTVQEQLWLQN